MVEQMLELTPGLQCCLRCGRTLTDRALHDSTEEAVLNSIRASRPEWVGASGECPPCVSEYRRLLGERQARAELPREDEAKAWMPALLSRAFGRRGHDSQAAPI